MKFNHIVIGAVLLTSSSMASATMIGVSDIDISNGSNSGLKWSTTENADFSFDLNGVSTQSYGSFSTKDFGIDFLDAIDIDHISASFTLTPPGSEASTNGSIYVTGYFDFWNTDTINVNFDNDWIDMGTYEVSFRDLQITGDGTYDLLADFRETASAAVPEPLTLGLFGLGLLGLRFSKRKFQA